MTATSIARGALLAGGALVVAGREPSAWPAIHGLGADEDGPELGCDVFISGTYQATVTPAGRGRFLGYLLITS